MAAVLVPMPTPGLPEPSGALCMVQSCCPPGLTYILKLGPPGIERVPVQSGATV